MSIWMLIVIATALGGALLLWHTVTRTKLASEEMLRQYSQILAEARQERAKKAAVEGGENPPTVRAEPHQERER